MFTGGCDGNQGIDGLAVYRVNSAVLVDELNPFSFFDLATRLGVAGDRHGISRHE